MRVFQYIAWLWKKMDGGARLLTVLAIFFLLCLISGIWIGKSALLVIIYALLALASILVAGLIAAAVVTTYKALLSSWKEFNRRNPPDDIKIINRLKGIDPDVDV